MLGLNNARRALPHVAPRRCCCPCQRRPGIAAAHATGHHGTVLCVRFCRGGRAGWHLPPLYLYLPTVMRECRMPPPEYTPAMPITRRQTAGVGRRKRQSNERTNMALGTTVP